MFKGKYFRGKKGFKGVASDSSTKQLARERGLPRGSPFFRWRSGYRDEGVLDGGREYKQIKRIHTPEKNIYISKNNG
ncbi:hypothetical protein BJP49_19920 [Paenibacillus odorifer]|nr:hypothetical protein BJP49_19920 [Paenibacillus odorifer]OZQ73519.1 hypothetical protein CA596_19025 [Paenibacillus odorifer]